MSSDDRPSFVSSRGRATPAGTTYQGLRVCRFRAPSGRWVGRRGRLATGAARGKAGGRGSSQRICSLGKGSGSFI